MRKVLNISLIAVILLLMALYGGAFSISLFRQWQASKLLDVVRQIHPGVTREAETRILLAPFAKYRLDSGGTDLDFQFANCIPGPLPVPWTLTLVLAHFKFEDGVLIQITFTEMQTDHAGYPHPNSASVSIYSNRPGSSSADFAGYSEHSRSTQELDSQGKWTGFECCHARFIELDGRATQAQFSRSLGFHLSCMTSFARCENDRQILP